MVKTKISLTEALRWAAEQLQALGLGVIPDEAKLQILIDRMKADTNAKMRLWQDALKDECRIQDPENPEEGELPEKRQVLARREQQGARYGEEHATASNIRKSELRRRMDQADSDMTRLEAEIAGLETILKTRQATRQMREKAYRTAKESFDKLAKVAPAILEQTKALREAEKERIAAAEAMASRGNAQDARSLLTELQAGLREAQAGAKAAELVLDDTDERDLDLDAIDEAEEAEAVANARINRWLKK
jgi:hypothetical protein